MLLPISISQKIVCFCNAEEVALNRHMKCHLDAFTQAV